MANKKFSQFVNLSSADLNTTFFVGYDSTLNNNVKITLGLLGASLGSLPSSNNTIDLLISSYPIPNWGVYSIIASDPSNTIILPSASSLPGQSITIFNKDGATAFFDTAVLPVDRSSTSTIDKIEGNSCVTMYSDGEYWRITYKNY